MRGLRVAHVEVVVGEDRTTHRRDQHHAVLDAKVVDGFGEVFLSKPMATTRAVGGCVSIDALAIRVAFELAVED